MTCSDYTRPFKYLDPKLEKWTTTITSNTEVQNSTTRSKLKGTFLSQDPEKITAPSFFSPMLMQFCSK